LNRQSDEISIKRAVKNSIWESLFSVDEICKLLRSPNPLTIFLDANDSDFSSYLVNILAAKPTVLSYSACFHSLKARQTTFAQTLLSLLFLEGNNIQTKHSFAEDFLVKSRRFRKFSTKYAVPNKTGRVFESLLLDSSNGKQVAAKFLKCMTCNGNELKKIGMYRDLCNSKSSKAFFAEVVGCMQTAKENKKDLLAYPIIFCFLDIPAEKLVMGTLEEMLESEILNGASTSNAKFWLVSRGKIGYTHFQELIAKNNDFKKFISVEEIPLLYPAGVQKMNPNSSSFATLTHLSKRVICEVEEKSQVFSGNKISYLLSDGKLEEFLRFLLATTEHELSVAKFSNSLFSLMELALNTYPSTLTWERIEAEFSA
jgi:hypothetical protein